MPRSTAQGRISDKLTDLDFAILGLLPDEGARKGNHTFAKQVKTIAEQLGDATSRTVSGRMRSLVFHKLVVTVVVPPVGLGLGYQITALGKTVLAERRGVSGNPLRVINGGV